MEKETIFTLRLREALANDGRTNKEIAESAGISLTALQSYIAKDTNKKKKPSVEYAVKLADALKVSVDWLTGRTDNPKAGQGISGYKDMARCFLDICTELNLFKVEIEQEKIGCLGWVAEDEPLNVYRHKMTITQNIRGYEDDLYINDSYEEFCRALMGLLPLLSNCTLNKEQFLTLMREKIRQIDEKQQSPTH